MLKEDQETWKKELDRRKNEGSKLDENFIEILKKQNELISQMLFERP